MKRGSIICINRQEFHYSACKSLMQIIFSGHASAFKFLSANLCERGINLDKHRNKIYYILMNRIRKKASWIIFFSHDCSTLNNTFFMRQSTLLPTTTCFTFTTSNFIYNSYGKNSNATTSNTRKLHNGNYYYANAINLFWISIKELIFRSVLYAGSFKLSFTNSPNDHWSKKFIVLKKLLLCHFLLLRVYIVRCVAHMQKKKAK